MTLPNDPVLERNLGALLRAADDRLSPADVDRACVSFLARVGREPERAKPWMALASAAAVLLAVAIWAAGGARTPGGQERAPLAAEIDRWIGDLAAEDASTREQATRALGNLGLDLADGLAALEKLPALPDEDARSRARRIAGILREGTGLSISHDDGPQRKPAPAGSKLRLEVFDVTDILEGNTMTGEDLAQMIQGNVLRDRWNEADGAGMSFNIDEGTLAVRNLLEVHDAIRAFFADLRLGASRPPARRAGIGDRISEFGAATRPDRDAAEARWRALGTNHAYALAALDRLRSSADVDLRLRAQELRTKLVEPLLPLFSHQAHRRAAVERIRAEWHRHRPEDLPELVRKSFEPCQAIAIEIHPDLLRSGLSPQAVQALRRGDGVVSLWFDRPFSFRTLGAWETTLAFTVPGEPSSCVTLRFER
jgi:hypothetical protein